eukprot:TRINITY_DN553_c0_g2_i1.p1 TRINITY_DN553_c0_g2~~TRINITY_DN553_c0_g2_i1.p1  ORF type:complete len:243 (-),score=70.13 TRINITY_DN553_c0_g2_i1:245-973(-)
MAEKGSHDSNVKKKKVLVFGGTGSGKSSVVNLLLNKEIATTSNSSVGCTFSHTSYESEELGLELFDTVGLGETKSGTVSDNKATDKLMSLVKEFSKDGLNLLVLCTSFGRLNAVTVQNYKFFFEDFCFKKVPCILCVTHSESERNVDKWTEETKAFLEELELEFKDVVCVIAMDRNHVFYDKYQQEITVRREKLIQSIQKDSLDEGWKKNFEDWAKQSLILFEKRTLNLFSGLKDKAKSIVK